MMTEYSPDMLLSRLSSFIATQIGLHFPKARWHELERKIAAAAREFGFPDGTSCGQWLLSAPLTRKQVQVLASHLTIGETYFFRERATFNALQDHILPELIQTRRRSGRQLRLWSAGCCTGEEPYSIAILLSQLIPDLKEWSLTLLATDINPQFLHKAVNGVYGEWSFRGLPSSIKERYFRKTAADRYEILPQFREQVTFVFHNLANDVHPSRFVHAGHAQHHYTNTMDVILCRNVLMYFAPEQAKKVVQNLYHSLADGGWLISSPSETSSNLFSEFQPVHFPGAILYQKKQAPVLGAEKSQHRMALPAASQERQRLVWRAENRPRPTQPAPSDSITSSMDATADQDTSSPTYRNSVALYKQGRYAEAEEKLRLCLVEQSEMSKALRLMARIHANQGKLDEALAWCQRAIAADQLNLGNRYLYATIQEERGEIEEAVKSLKRALYLDPNFVLAHFALGCLARGAGKQQEADKHFGNMLTLLRKYQPEEILPESDGLTSARLLETVEAVWLPSHTEN